MRKYKYSEIFGETIQGEGQYCGIPTVWIRFFGCNFNCGGFGQANPRDPSTWVKEYEELDLTGIESMKDLPVLKFGCDSSYSWSRRFSHLAHQKDVIDICNELEDWLMSSSNLESQFLHPVSRQWTHLAFTGGEPMLNQMAMSEIVYEFCKRKNYPGRITVETNGTQPLREDLAKMLNLYKMSDEFRGLIPDSLGTPEWFWSVSPKLSSSGEKWEKAIRPEYVGVYNQLSSAGQLKYVVDGSEETWDEVNRATELFRKEGIEWPVWIMPVGGTREDQEKIAGDICEEACRRGYYTAARLHCYLFGNRVGK